MSSDHDSPPAARGIDLSPDARRIDLNADLGEGYGPWSMGHDAAMLKIVSSANVACGGHAGDPETMFATAAAAAADDVVIGAHPAYADRAGFGRRVIPMKPAEIGRMVAGQVGALRAIAALVPITVDYVKVHGALANQVAASRDVAAAVVEAVQSVDDRLAILAISGTEIERVARRQGAPTFSEVFADRGYRPDGQLIPRDQPGALLHDVAEATDRLVGFLETGLIPTPDGSAVALHADSVCVHGDSPNAVALATSVREALTANHIALAPFASPVT